MIALAMMIGAYCKPGVAPDPSPGGFFLLEDGTSSFLLEDGTSKLLKE